MDYIVGLTEQELEYFYNKSEGFSHYSELDEMERMELAMNTTSYIRDMMHKVARHESGEIKMGTITKWFRVGGRARPDIGIRMRELHVNKRREKASSDS